MFWYLAIPILLTVVAVAFTFFWSAKAKEVRNMVVVGVLTLCLVGMASTILFLLSSRQAVTVTKTVEPPRTEIAAANVASAVASDLPGHTLKSGEEWNVPAGWCVSGDIQVWGSNGWVNMFDSNEGSQFTGQVTVFRSVAKIRAPWGAYADPDDGAELMKTRLSAAGCEGGKGCRSVTITSVQ